MRRIVLLLASMTLAVIFGSGEVLADSPTTKEDCKNGGYAKYGFKNQGECIKAVNHAAPADTTAPETTITEALQPGTNELHFRFTSSEPNSTFECRIVNLSETWELCTSQKIYTDLPDGEHTFQVRAIDSAGNIDSTPAELGPVTIDETLPTGSITSGPADGATVNTNHVEFGWEASDNIAVHTVGCGLRKELSTGGSTTINPDSGSGVCDDESDMPETNPATFSNLADGEYTFQLSITDRGNNNIQLTRTFTVDSTPPPIPTITSGPTGGELTTSNVTFEFNSGNESDLQYICYVDRPNTQQVEPADFCSSPKSYNMSRSGELRFHVKAVDVFGRSSDYAIAEFTVDAAEPAVNLINFDHDNPPGAVEAKLSTSDQSRPLAYECELIKYSLETQSYSNIIQDGACVPDEGPDPEGLSGQRDVTFSWDNLEPGSYQLTFSFTDKAGNVRVGPRVTFGINT